MCIYIYIINRNSKHICCVNKNLFGMRLITNKSLFWKHIERIYFYRFKTHENSTNITFLINTQDILPTFIHCLADDPCGRNIYVSDSTNASNLNVIILVTTYIKQVVLLYLWAQLCECVMSLRILRAHIRFDQIKPAIFQTISSCHCRHVFNTGPVTFLWQHSFSVDSVGTRRAAAGLRVNS